MKSSVGLLDQYHLLYFASKDTRLSAGDPAVLAEITDRCLKNKHDTRPTGITHLVRETGRARNAVKASLRRLMRCHYLTVVSRGVGTRGTAYAPNFGWSRQVSSLIAAKIKRRGLPTA